jgi:hypothetical protein
MTRKKPKAPCMEDEAGAVAPVAAVVRLDERVRDRLEIRRQDAHADALATQFHAAMGWREKQAKIRSKRKKKS